MQEEFRKIDNFNNYSVSNTGKIRNDTTGRILKNVLNTLGYHIVTLINDEKRCGLRVHRLVAKAFIPNDDPTKDVVDHIDNNPGNNNVSNLRWVSQRENTMNSTISKNNSSGVKGVSLHKKSGKWSAYIWQNRKKVHLGLFRTKEEAILARVNAAEEMFGEYINNCERNIIINIQNLNINQ